MVGGERRLIHRRGLPPARANFAVARMLARVFLERESWWLPTSEATKDEIERELAAWVVAPPEPFSATVAQVGLDLRALASTFVITETAAALRAIEVEHLSTAPSRRPIESTSAEHRSLGSPTTTSARSRVDLPGRCAKRSSATSPAASPCSRRA